jgi:transposase
MAESITRCTYYRDWGKYNDDLVKRAESLGDLSWICDWDSDLKRMNAGKKGRPYEYPDSLFVYCAKQMHSKNCTYRTVEGDLRCILKAYGKGAPDHSTIEARCALLEWGIEPPAYPRTADFTVDSTGISSTVRGEYLRDEYGIKRGFVKFHVLADTETGEILSFAVTSSGISDGSVALTLIDAVSGYELGRGFMDAAYDHRKIWTGLMERHIEPVINLRSNDAHANGCLYKGEMIAERKELGAEAWKKRHDYGRRWKAECTFSDFKRVLGSFVRARRSARVVREISCKVWIHNANKKFRGQ